MTSKEFFREWMRAAENHSIEDFDIWEAACDYQRESDAKLAESKVFDDSFRLAKQIRNNK